MDSKRRSLVRQAYYAYLLLSPKQRADYRVPSKLRTGDTVTADYLWRRLAKNIAFTEQGAYDARQLFVETVASLIQSGFFECVSPQEALGRYRVNQALYRVGVTTTPGVP